MSATTNSKTEPAHLRAVVPADFRVTEPKSEYARRLGNRQATVQYFDRWDRRIATARGIVFIAFCVTLYFAVGGAALSPFWLILPTVVFVALVLSHGSVARQLVRARRAVTYYEIALERLNHEWIGKGATGNRYQDVEHLYSADLDLFGSGSLFELICRARTRIGEDTLARWLGAPADPKSIRQRQSAIDELRHSLDFREEVALLDAEVHDEIDQNELIAWSHQTPEPFSIAHRLAAIGLGVAAVVTLIGWVFGVILASALVVVLLVEILFLFSIRRRIREVSRSADPAGSGLAILSQVLSLIEREEFQTPLLAKLRAVLDTDGRPPSERISQLQSRIRWLNNCLQNQFFAPFALAFCLPVHLIHRIEIWRERFGANIPEWLEAVGEFEALSSLAGYAFEQAGDPFPRIISDGCCFEAESLGHPLIPDVQCVRNDIEFGDGCPLMMVSGSNMSGKSTLLRSVGINVVLALAGAPVRAKALRVSPFAVGTAMRVHDSLQHGASLFYQVISRIKSVVECSGNSPPLLFLLDEILQGTNSQDRRVGADGIIRQLIDRGAVGLVTTHDLALTDIVSTMEHRARNVHFEDHLVDGRMTFDFQLRPGVVQKSNALELMRMIGLDVDVDSEEDTESASTTQHHRFEDT